MKIGPDLLNVMTTPLSLMPRDSNGMMDDLTVSMRSFMNYLCISEGNIDIIINTIISQANTSSRSWYDSDRILDWLSKILAYIMDSITMLAPRDKGWFLRSRFHSIRGDAYLILTYGCVDNPTALSNKLITNSDNTYPYFKE